MESNIFSEKMQREHSLTQNPPLSGNLQNFGEIIELPVKKSSVVQQYCSETKENEEESEFDIKLMAKRLRKENILLFPNKEITVLEIYGKGGFGDVYRAYDSQMGEYRAIKVAKRKKQQSKDWYLALVGLEREIMSKLDSYNHENPNLLKYYGIFKTSP